MLESSRFFDIPTDMFVVKDVSLSESTAEVIENKIQSIITERQSKIPGINKVHFTLNEIKNCLTDFKIKKNGFIERVRTDSSMMKNFNVSERNETLKNVLSITDDEINSIIEQINDMLRYVTDAQRRFGKDSVCIGIVGGARNGKSRLIQTITGLSEDVIPTSEDDNCTGARTIIENSDTFRAEIEFYSTQELLDDVISKYQQEKNFAQAGAGAIQLRTLGDIKKLYDFLASNHELIESSQYLERLKAYIDHESCYWKYLSDDEPKTLTLHEGQKNEIRRFVSQLSERKDNRIEYYYDFLAVKRVKIYCPFTVTTVRKIILIDTVGIGETSLGIEEKMLETVSMDTDFVLMLRQMSLMPKAILQDDDYKLYFTVVNAMKKALPNKWCYWVFNRRASDYKSGIFYERYFSKLESKIKSTEKPLFPAGVLNIDCSDAAEVMHSLVEPMLEHIVRHLSDIDQQYITEINSFSKEINRAFNSLMANIKTITVSESERVEFLSEKCIEAHKKLVIELHEFVEKYKAQDYQRIPNVEVGKIISLMPLAVPTISEIQKNQRSQSNQSYLLTANWAFEETVKRLDQMLKNQTLHFDKVVTDFKILVIKNIMEISGFDKCIDLDYHSEHSISDAANKLFGSLTTYGSELLRLFNELDAFNIKDELNLNIRLAKLLDRYLCVNNNPDEDAGLFPASWTMSSGAKNLSDTLLNHIDHIQTSFMLDIDNLKVLPKNTINDTLVKFVNQITNEQNKEAWRTVYTSNASVLWRDGLSELESRARQIVEWNELIQDLAVIENIIELKSEELV